MDRGVTLEQPGAPKIRRVHGHSEAFPQGAQKDGGSGGGQSAPLVAPMCRRPLAAARGQAPSLYSCIIIY